MKKRPNNIIIFQTDQLAAPALGLYGGIAKTPCLDTIAKDGVVFENAYCNYPLCAPSRFSMMSGQLPLVLRLPWAIRHPGTTSLSRTFRKPMYVPQRALKSLIERFALPRKDTNYQVVSGRYITAQN